MIGGSLCDQDRFGRTAVVGVVVVGEQGIEANDRRGIGREEMIEVAASQIIGDVVDTAARRVDEHRPCRRCEEARDVHVRVDRAQALERVDHVCLFYGVVGCLRERDERVERRCGCQRNRAEKPPLRRSMVRGWRDESAVWPPSECPTVTHEAETRAPRSSCVAVTPSMTARALACPMRYVWMPGVPSPG